MTPLKESWRLAWPLILANISVPLLGMVDTGIVGHMGNPIFLGAVALGSILISVISFVFGFLRMALTGLTAQATGARNNDEIRAGLIRFLAIGFTLGVIIAALRTPIANIASYGYGPPVEIIAPFETYVTIRLLAIPATIMNMVVWAWLLGTQRSRGPLVLLVFVNGINATLDFILVFGFGLGIAGVAWASVGAEYLGLIASYLLIRPVWRLHDTRPLRELQLWSRQAFTRIFAINGNLFLRTALMEVVFLSFAAIGARLGETALAVNAIMFNFFTLSAFGLDGFSFATEAMIGKAIGAGDMSKIRSGVRAGAINALTLALLLALVYALATGPIIRLMTDLEGVRTAAYAYQPYVVLIPLIGIWAWLLDGIFFGATRAATLRDAMALCLVIFVIAAAIFVPLFGNHGLWIAMLVYLAARGLILAFSFRRTGYGANFVEAAA